jgi:anti-sigma regulatory factor (Ser/Thr protein kinase)
MAAVAVLNGVRFVAEVTADLAEMATARDTLADALQECGWNQEDAFRVLICADEAMANAVSHGSAPAGMIDVRFRVSTTAAALVIGDHRSGVIDIPASDALPDDTCEQGRGVILMRALADAFRMWRRPQGTMVALAFRTAEGTAR